MILAELNENMQTVVLVMAVVFFLVLLIFAMLFAAMFKIWLKCVMAGTNVTLFQIVGMKLRKSPADKLCDLKIMATQADLRSISLNDIESAYLAGADVELMIRAMIKAKQIDQPLSWEEALEKAQSKQFDDYVEENYEP